MSHPINHHYTSRSYLEAWCIDKKLTTITNYAGKIDKQNYSTKSVGCEEHLYSKSSELPLAQRVSLETDFFAPLDNESALVLKKLNAEETLSNEEKKTWAKYVNAQHLRTPKQMDVIKQIAEHHITRAIASAESEYSKIRKITDPATMKEWASINRPHLAHNTAIDQIPTAVNSRNILSHIHSMNWHVSDLSKSEIALLTCDNPAIFTHGLKNPNCVIALPISPSKCFFATHRNSPQLELLMSTSHQRLAKSINTSIVSQAIKHVFSQPSKEPPDNFFKKWLRTV